jgi:hypothetical protein
VFNVSCQCQTELWCRRKAKKYDSKKSITGHRSEMSLAPLVVLGANISLVFRLSPPPPPKIFFLISCHCFASQSTISHSSIHSTSLFLKNDDDPIYYYRADEDDVLCHSLDLTMMTPESFFPGRRIFAV